MYIASIVIATALWSNVDSDSFDPTSVLVGYWPSNGTAYDFSGHSNHGTVNGAKVVSGVYQSTITSWNTERTNYSFTAFHFDGIDDFIRIEDMSQALDLSQSKFTLCFWAKRDGSGGQTMAGTGDKGQFRIQNPVF